jgi:nitric oxide reductase large subunit
VRPISKEAFQRFWSEKDYLKIFVISILLLIVGIILIFATNLYITYADPSTPGELEDYYRNINSLQTFTALFFQLGMILFVVSTFLGGLRDDTLSPEVRKGMIFASSVAMVGFVVVMVLIL